MALTTKRIIALPSQNDPQEGDYLAIDNATSGTHKIPVGRVGVEVDDTLTEQGKAADAKAVGDALDEIRSQIEVTGTASGAIATFADGSDNPMKSCTAEIVPKQSGSGTPSPSNVRPISGWESVSVNVAGKNIYSGESQIIIDKPVARGTTIYIQIFDGTFTGSTLYAKTITADWVGIGAITTTKNAITINRDDILQIKLSSSAYSDLNRSGSKLMASFTDFDTFAPYNGHTTTPPLGRTVYGGTLDVVSGELTVDRAIVTLNGTQNISLTNWRPNASSVGWVYPYSLLNNKIVGADVIPNLLCDKLETVAYNTIYSGTNNMVGLVQAGYSLAVRTTDTSLTTTSAINAYLAQNPITVVYELKTPQTYTLTPTEVNTLLGDNNVWADAGDVAVVYVRDLNITINNLLNSNGTRSLGMMAMSAPTKNTADEQSDEQTEEPAEDDMR